MDTAGSWPNDHTLNIMFNLYGGTAAEMVVHSVVKYRQRADKTVANACGPLSCVMAWLVCERRVKELPYVKVDDLLARQWLHQCVSDGRLYSPPAALVTSRGMSREARITSRTFRRPHHQNYVIGDE